MKQPEYVDWDVPIITKILVSIFNRTNNDKSGRSLSWVDGSGNTYWYFASPFKKSVFFILLQEFCERFAYYSVTPNVVDFIGQRLFRGDPSAAALASAYWQSFQTVLYVTPVMSAIIADTLLGCYMTITVFSMFYLAGQLILVIAGLPEMADQGWLVHLGLMTLMSIGSGGVKSCVNVLGAHQFHPIKQATGVTTFYAYFYCAINVGSLIGGILVPLVIKVAVGTEEDPAWFAGYGIVLGMSIIETTIFLCGSFRYVKMVPQGSAVLGIIKILGYSIRYCGFDKLKKSNGGNFDDENIEDAKQVLRLIPLFALIIPFILTYYQMNTGALQQGKRLDSGGIPPEIIQNTNPVSVIVMSLFAGSILYPCLKKCGIVVPVCIRFAIGSVFASLAAVTLWGTETLIMESGISGTVSVGWQVLTFSLIGFGEIFLISTSYEVAFTFAPGPLKAVASALNLLFFALGSFLAGQLFSALQHWLLSFELNSTLFELAINKGLADGATKYVVGDTEKELLNNLVNSTITASRWDAFYLIFMGISLSGAFLSLLAWPYFNKIKRLFDERQAAREEYGDKLEAQKAGSDAGSVNTNENEGVEESDAGHQDDEGVVRPDTQGEAVPVA